MCGICGTAGFEDEHLLREMCSVMKHRGPDDDNTSLDAGFGHYRMKIRMKITSVSMCRWIS